MKYSLRGSQAISPQQATTPASPASPTGSTHDQPGFDEKPAIVQDIPIYNDLELVSETDLSIGSILKGSAAKPLTNFERKAAFINAELDKLGMGRYQWYIWFLCGFGEYRGFALSPRRSLALLTFFLRLLPRSWFVISASSSYLSTFKTSADSK